MNPDPQRAFREDLSLHGFTEVMRDSVPLAWLRILPIHQQDCICTECISARQRNKMLVEINDGRYESDE
jgi:hypothetical protein